MQRNSHLDVNVVARHIHPSAFDPYDTWSSKIADVRQAARLAAQKIIRDNPARARRIMMDWRADRDMKRIRERTNAN